MAILRRGTSTAFVNDSTGTINKTLGAAQDITDITAANPAVVTIVGHGYSNGNSVYISGVGGMVELTDGFYTVANKTADTFELSGVNSSTYTAFTTGGTAEVVTNAGTTSSVITLTETLVGLITDSALASGNLTITGSTAADGTFVPIFNNTPTALGVTSATASKWYVFNPDVTRGLTHIKIVNSAAQAVDTPTVITPIVQALI